MLSILNATVSHELRNPLNSIVGQNTRKESLYEDMQILISELESQELDFNMKSLKLQKMKTIMGSLEDGLKVQDSSAKMMSFLV